LRAKTSIGAASGAPTVFDAQAKHLANWPLSGFSRRRSTIIHPIVRCTPDMSGETAEQRSDAPTVDCNEQ
jgi:hypothetical protein